MGFVRALVTCFTGLSILLAASAVQAAPSFGEWLEGLRAEAVRKGISRETLDKALAKVEPIPRVIELDRNQPEFTLTFEQYMERVVPPARVQKGRQRLEENRALLESVSRKYGVPARFIVAFWGIETDFGRTLGGFSVIPALATLAYDGRRSAFFRAELLDALRIVEEGHVDPEEMMGSWAGAMGQVQFMPSSFVRFAVDENGDGRKDIWYTPADIFASAANYLARSGWRAEQPWGQRVTLPESLKARLDDLKEKEKAVSEWQALGIRRSDGSAFQNPETRAILVVPTAAPSPAFLGYENYETILKWNRSHYFALAVAHLADRIADR